MFNKSFLAFALLHISVPAISVAFFGASPFWLFGSLLFAAATIRSLYETDSVYVVTFLCLLSGAAFSLTLMLGTCYYMQGEGFNDSFFYHLNTGSLLIASRGYGSVFYPSLLGLVLAFFAPAIIYKTQSNKLWPAIPVVLLWVLALVGNYPVYSLTIYQMSMETEPSLPTLNDASYPELTSEQPVTDLPEPETGKEETAVSKQVDNQDIVEENSSAVEDPVEILPAESFPEEATPLIPTIVKTESLPETQRNPQPETQATAEPKLRLKKNIILIYAESLESLYFDTELFGDLVPNIRKLSAKAHSYTNLVQVGGTGWTIAGIVASQCGFPLKVSNHLASNSTMASVDRPYPDETCLADILSDNGYETVYMGGAPLWFAGKENFLRTHGYKRISGDKKLASLLSDKEYQSGWGLYDDSLFELALVELQSLEKDTQPYLLTLLTLDTHHPNGIPSKSCKKLVDNGDSMSNAIYCSDQMIGNFINEAMKIVDMNDTIIVLFSDHLSLRNTLWSKLKANKQRRRLTFMIFDNAPATVSNTRATHFDVAPTILEAARVRDQTKVGAGVSLFTRSPKEQSGKPVAQKADSTPALLNPTASIKDNGIVLSRRELSLKIGDLTLNANNNGQKFRSGMYLVAVTEQGNVVDSFYSDDYESLAKNLNGTFVIGISVMQAPPYSAMYFYGKISPDGTEIIQRAFNSDIHLTAAEIWPPQEIE
jgi:arylsulfatase A-like enzyme